MPSTYFFLFIVGYYDSGHNREAREFVSSLNYDAQLATKFWLVDTEDHKFSLGFIYAN